MVHERGQRKPYTIYHRKLILQYGRIRITGIRRVPLIRTEASNNKQHKGHNNERADHIDPELWRQWRQEREELRRFLSRALVQNTYAQIQERIRKVNDLLSHKTDTQRSHSQVGLLFDELANHAIPFAVHKSTV